MTDFTGKRARNWGRTMQAFGQSVTRLEEILIAILLGAMTLITFANVVLRYGFGSGLLWGLEAVVFLFAWLVLLGASYCVKINAHIGVDAFVVMAPAPLRKALTLLSVAACLAFSILLLVGAWNYWWRFASTAAFLEVNDIPMPVFLQFLAEWLNEGEEYEKMPRFIPYFILPLSMALLALRFLQAGWRVYTGRQELIIVSHEAEDAVEEAGRSMRDSERD